MKKFFENKLNTVLTVILGVLILTLLGHSVISALTPQTKPPYLLLTQHTKAVLILI